MFKLKYCTHCGKELEDDAKYCMGCGCACEAITNNKPKPINEADDHEAWPQVLAFFLPVVGLILFLVWQEERPIKAKRVGKWALIGFIVGVILAIALFICIFLYFHFLVSGVVGTI